VKSFFYEAIEAVLWIAVFTSFAFCLFGRV
jgi:hypothetical protein